MSRELLVTAIGDRRLERALSRTVGGPGHRTRARAIVELTVECESEGERRSGLGEASPLPGYSLDTDADVIAGLRRVREQLPWHLPLDGNELATIEHLCRALAPALRAGLETALLDAVGQVLQRPLWSFLTDGAAPCHPVPLSSQLVGPDDELVEEAAQQHVLGFRTLKRKLDSDATERQLEALRRLSDVRLRLDANRALSCERLLSLRTAIDALHCELFEEPVSEDLASALARDEPALAGLPIALDESLAASTSAAAMARFEAFGPALGTSVRAVVVKPTRDGLVGALRLAQSARRHGVHTIVTHCWEGAVGRLAAAQLALALHRKGGYAHAPTLPPGLVEDDSPASALLDAAAANGLLYALDRPGLGTASDDA